MDHARSFISVDVAPPRESGAPPFRVATTHLCDHSEDARLEQWAQARGAIAAADAAGIPLLLLGDFNALTRADYSASLWARVGRSREAGYCEAPRSELTGTAIPAAGLVDLRVHARLRDAAAGSSSSRSSSASPREDPGEGPGAEGSFWGRSGGEEGVDPTGCEAAVAAATAPAAEAGSPAAVAQGPLGTCRFGTRIDYAFANGPWMAAFRLTSIRHVPAGGATDHAAVVAEFEPRVAARLPGEPLGDE